MKYTKLVMLGLALGTAATFATAVQADMTDNGDGTQTIDNSKDPVLTDAEVTVSGLLGFDNTNPITPEPENPDSWINVSLPTATIFSTDEKTQHEDITSSIYTVKNNSGRPVRINVGNYKTTATNTGDLGNIDSLNLNAGALNINLITGGTIPSFSGNDVLMTLASPKAEAGDYQGSATGAFTFTGKTASSWNQADEQAPEQLDTTLTLSLTPLDKAGNEYVSTP